PRVRSQRPLCVHDVGRAAGHLSEEVETSRVRATGRWPHGGKRAGNRPSRVGTDRAVALSRMLDNLRQDLALARRHLGRGGFVTAVAVLSLAVGIAANTTVFSLVHALAFPRLIYPDAGRMVFLESKNDARGIAEMMMSAPDGRDVGQAARALQGVSV